MNMAYIDWDYLSQFFLSHKQYIEKILEKWHNFIKLIRVNIYTEVYNW